MTSLSIADRSFTPNKRAEDLGGSIAGMRADAIESELLRALDEGEIEVLFQPQFSCRTGAVIGAEALARWRHPALGVLGANELFAAAEHAKLLRVVSRHVASRALEEAASWPVQLKLSLNILPDELVDPHFADDFSSLIEQSALAPNRLTLEVTETLLLGNLEQAASALTALGDLGVRIALDDFGAGFCNFRYLRELPLDMIKLDKIMVDHVPDDAKALAVFRAMVQLGRALELDICAEGIESETQLTAVQSEGCHFWQGFLRSPPIPSDALVELVRTADAG
ncbi:MAG: EAL domain-containing protein [Pseudomonadota bacterium]